MLGEELKRVRGVRAADRKKLNVLSAVQKARLLELREQKEVSRLLLPDAPERKQRRKPSPTQVPCPLLPGTVAIPPSRKRRHWEVEAGPSTSTDSTTSSVEIRPWRACSPTPEAAEPAAQLTPTGKKGEGKLPPKKILFSPSTGVQTAVEVDSRTIVNAEIDFIGFTPTSSPGLAQSAIGSSPTPSTSSVTNEPSVFEDVEDEVAAWERSIAQNPGSDEEADLPDWDGVDVVPRQRN